MSLLIPTAPPSGLICETRKGSCARLELEYQEARRFPGLESRLDQFFREPNALGSGLRLSRGFRPRTRLLVEGLEA